MPSRCVAPVLVEWDNGPPDNQEAASGPLPLMRDAPTCGTGVAMNSPLTTNSDLLSYPVPEVLLAMGLSDNGLGKGSPGEERNETGSPGGESNKARTPGEVGIVTRCGPRLDRREYSLGGGLQLR
jgi:hypothetical protein